MMSSTTEKSAKPVQEVKTPEDLSRAIEGAIVSHAGEQPRCVRVYGHHYRCNWWVQEQNDVRGKNDSPFASNATISRSQFLRATRTDGALKIEDATIRH